MYLLEAGASVIQLQFFPDGRRLLAGVVSPEGVVSFDVCTLPDGRRVRLPLPPLDVKAWWYSGYGNAVAVHPSGEWCHVAWGGRLFSLRTADGAPLPVPDGVEAHQVVISPGGDRLLAAHASASRKLYALTADAAGGTVVWEKAMPQQFRHVAGFLPDGERFVTIESHAVRVRTFATDDEQASIRYPAGHAYQPQLSPDARHLGVIGYGSMYLFDTAVLGKPRRITSTRTYGNFQSFAFHPAGRTLAVIHGGPTLAKIYDLGTLRLVRKYNWKLGPLGCVAFSPDGMLGAAGSRDGRIILWDVDQ